MTHSILTECQKCQHSDQEEPKQSVLLPTYPQHLLPTLTPRQLRATLAGQRYYQGHQHGTYATHAELCAFIKARYQRWQYDNTSVEWQIHFIGGWHAAVLADPTAEQGRPTAAQAEATEDDQAAPIHGEPTAPAQAGPEGGNDGGWSRQPSRGDDDEQGGEWSRRPICGKDDDEGRAPGKPRQVAATFDPESAEDEEEEGPDYQARATYGREDEEDRAPGTQPQDDRIKRALLMLGGSYTFEKDGEESIDWPIALPDDGGAGGGDAPIKAGDDDDEEEEGGGWMIARATYGTENDDEPGEAPIKAGEPTGPSYGEPTGPLFAQAWYMRQRITQVLALRRGDESEQDGGRRPTWDTEDEDDEGSYYPVKHIQAIAPRRPFVVFNSVCSTCGQATVCALCGRCHYCEDVDLPCAASLRRHITALRACRLNEYQPNDRPVFRLPLVDDMNGGDWFTIRHRPPQRPDDDDGNGQRPAILPTDKPAPGGAAVVLVSRAQQAGKEAQRWS